MVLVFSDLNRAQIYKMPYRDSGHHEIEILMSFVYLSLFEPKEDTKEKNFYSKFKKKFNFLWVKN